MEFSPTLLNITADQTIYLKIEAQNGGFPSFEPIDSKLLYSQAI